MDIIEELVGESSFTDHNRLQQLIGEYQAGIESMIVHNGHRLAISLSARTFSQAGALSEIWSGVHQLQTIRQWTAQSAGTAKLDQLAEILTSIGSIIFDRSNLVMAAIGETEQIDRCLTVMGKSKTLSGFKTGGDQPQFDPLTIALSKTPPHEGWSTSTAVAFVAQTVPTVSIEHVDAPVLAVVSKMLRSLYLHREIREKGGAYGGFAVYNPETGLFSLASYRDPHIVRTLEVFDGVKTFGRANTIKTEDITEAVLQVCSEIDKPDPPGPSARKAFSRLIIGLTDEARLAFKQALLQVNQDRVIEVVEKYFGSQKAQTGTAVIAGADQFKTANAQLGRPLELATI
jgi:Zn-dependent M16 (insulinase) family peptidase